MEYEASGAVAMMSVMMKIAPSTEDGDHDIALDGDQDGSGDNGYDGCATIVVMMLTR